MLYRHASCCFALSALALSLFVLPARAQSSPDASASVLEDPIVRFQAKRGLDYLYDLRYEEAEGLFRQIDERFPDHPIGPFLLGLNTWWRILSDLQDESHDDAFFAQMEEVIDRADERLERDPDDFDAQFFKGAALGFRGRLRSNRGNWFKSAMDGREALGYVLGVAEADTSNADFGFGKGLYDYYAAVIPARYPFTRPVMSFFPEGDRENGIALLQRAADEGHYVQTEAIYFLLQIHYLFERDYSASLGYVRQLRERHPHNAFFHAFEGRVLSRQGRYLEADTVFVDVLDRFQEGQRGYSPSIAEQALYYLGRSALLRDAYQAALNRFLQLDALAARDDDDSYFETLGRLRQGMAYDGLGQREQARARYREVLRMEDHSGAHDRARRYLERPYPG